MHEGKNESAQRIFKVWSLGSLPVARGSGTPHRAVIVAQFVDKCIEFVMGRQADLRPCLLGLVLLWKNTANGGGHHGILMFASNREQIGVYQVLLRRNDGRHPLRSVGNCLERTALTTSFMRQVAKVDAQEVYAELRLDGETSSRRWTDRRWRCG